MKGYQHVELRIHMNKCDFGYIKQSTCKLNFWSQLIMYTFLFRPIQCHECHYKFIEFADYSQHLINTHKVKEHNGTETFIEYNIDLLQQQGILDLD